jgi:uncharacterized protein (DUF305 family)
MSWRRLGLALTVAGAFGCRSLSGGSEPALIQPGAPGDPPRAITPQAAADLSQIRHTAKEVQFVEGMIAHHQQALSMTALIPERTSSTDIRLLGRRIELSQADEIQMMRGWLTAQGVAPPDASHHEHNATLMPGMLTTEEMGRLGDATAAAFDRLFLEFMIKHHGGALTMVEELFSVAGAGQQSDIFAFASDVEADQRIEIERMSAMLQERAK